MPQLRKAPNFSTGNAWALSLFRERRFEWSCPACEVYGTVEASDDVDRSLETIKAHHALVSPDCPNSLQVIDEAS
jgi:hypothetical protein